MPFLHRSSLSCFIDELLLRSRFFEPVALAPTLAQLLERLDIAIGLQQFGALGDRTGLEGAQHMATFANARGERLRKVGSELELRQRYELTLPSFNIAADAAEILFETFDVGSDRFLGLLDVAKLLAPIFAPALAIAKHRSQAKTKRSHRFYSASTSAKSLRLTSRLMSSLLS